MQHALNFFERYIKQKFSNIVDTRYPLRVVGLLDNQALGIFRRKMWLDGSTVHSFFEPILDEDTQLIRQQIRATPKPPKAILLVGGLGQSPALLHTVEATFKKGGVEVIRPANGYGAD